MSKTVLTGLAEVFNGWEDDPDDVVPSPECRTVNLKAAAKELGVSIPTIYRLAHEDALPVPVIRIGNRMVVSREALDALFSARKTG